MEEFERNKPVSKISNTTSEKYLAQKFLREFDRIVHDLFTEISPKVEEGEQKGTILDLRVNYIRFKELLMRLGMISELAFHI